MSDRERNEKLYTFYSQCQEKGYVNMKDDKQSLKAKVIAYDLGLKYSNIVNLYNEASNIAKEKSRLESYNGELLFSIYPYSYDEFAGLDLYLTDDGAYYAITKDGRLGGTPFVFVGTEERGSSYIVPGYSSTSHLLAPDGTIVDSFTRSKPTQFKTRSFQLSALFLSIGDEQFRIGLVKPSQALSELFKRDTAFIKYSSEYPQQSTVSNRVIGIPEIITTTQGSDLSSLLNRMIKKASPPTDRELYKKACAELAEASSTSEIKKAIDSFELISDYGDASEQIKQAKTKYEEALQLEKEKLVLRKEKQQKGKNVFLTILALAALIAGIAAGVITHSNAVKQIPAIEQKLSSSYNCYSGGPTYYDWYNITINKSKGSLRFHNIGMHGGPPYTEKTFIDDTSDYVIQVQGFKSYVIKAGGRSFSIDLNNGDPWLLIWNGHEFQKGAGYTGKK